MNIRIEINCESAAFADHYAGNELATILHNLTVKLIGRDEDRVLEEVNGLRLRDSNGNTVGRVWVTK
jgi:hypothetical protein